MTLYPLFSPYQAVEYVIKSKLAPHPHIESFLTFVVPPFRVPFCFFPCQAVEYVIKSKLAPHPDTSG